MDEINNTSNIVQQNSSKLPKIIFGVFGLILAVELIFAIKTLTTPTPSSPALNNKKSYGEKIILQTSNLNPKVSDNVAVEIWLASDKLVSGADVILKFDSKYFSSSGSGDLKKGEIFSEYPLLSMNAQKGEVKLSGLASATKDNFKGMGLFATVNLKTKSVGATKISVDFEPNKSEDSNIAGVDSGEDMLQEVKNLELTIK
mgnify:CR=1 FL=1